MTDPTGAGDQPVGEHVGLDTGPAPGAAVQPGEAEEREFTVKARSQARMILRRFLQHRLAVASLAVFVLLVLVALFGAELWRYDYGELTDELSASPSLQHPMGTDTAGGDLLARVLRGAQVSMQVALLVAALSTVGGTLLGAIAGYYRGVVDALLMRVTDLFLVVPSLAIFALLARIVGGDWLSLALIIAAFSWMPIARVVRAEILSLREKEYVEAARALGASDAHIIRKHLLPNAVGSIIVNATVTVAIAILAETGLSFLGLGIQAPDTSLGRLVSEGQAAFQTRPWLFYFPGLFIILICLTINFIGDGLRDAFDPRQTRVRQ